MSDIISNITTWLEHPDYTNGTTIQAQIQCYSLPFGAWGFASHILTYYTVICLIKGIRPSQPWHSLSKTKLAVVWDCCIGVLTFLITVLIATLTIVRCRNTWQFVLIAVWKLVLSISMTGITVHAAVISVKLRSQHHEMKPLATRAYRTGEISDEEGAHMLASQKDDAETKKQSEKSYRKLFWWILLYFLGWLPGFVGLMDLVREYYATIPRLQTISIVFLSVAGGCTLMAVLLFVIPQWRGNNSARIMAGGVAALVFWAAVVMTILSALYSDWALGAMDGDLSGTPEGSNKFLYFLYWAAKRLPMLSV